MSPIVPFDIIIQIIDILGQNKETDVRSEEHTSELQSVAPRPHTFSFFFLDGHMEYIDSGRSTLGDNKVPLNEEYNKGRYA